MHGTVSDTDKTSQTQAVNKNAYKEEREGDSDLRNLGGLC